MRSGLSSRFVHGMEAIKRSFDFLTFPKSPPPSTTSDAPLSSSVVVDVLQAAALVEQPIDVAISINALGIDNHHPPPPHDDDDDDSSTGTAPYHFDWEAIIVGFSLTSAVEIALQSLQPQIKLPSLVHLLSLAMIFAFASVFVSSFLSPNHPNLADVFRLVAKVSVFAAFFFAITVPFSLSLKIISWSIFSSCLVAIAYATFNRGRVPHE